MLWRCLVGFVNRLLLTFGILVAGTRDQWDQAGNADKGERLFHSDNSISSICLVSTLDDAYVKQTHRWAIVSKPISSLTCGLPCGKGMAIGVRLTNARLYIDRLADFDMNKSCVSYQSLSAYTRQTTGNSRGPEGDFLCRSIFISRSANILIEGIESLCDLVSSTNLFDKHGSPDE